MAAIQKDPVLVVVQRRARAARADPAALDEEPDRT